MQPAVIPDGRKLAQWLPGIWTEIGWLPPDDLTFEGYCQIGVVLALVERAKPWWWGDYILHGERKYGETYAQAMDLSGLSYDTLASYVRVCRRFEFGMRRQDLSFSHHKELAVDELDGDDRFCLLDDASRLHLSSRELGDHRRRYVAERRLARTGDLIDAGDDGREPPRVELEWVYTDPAASTGGDELEPEPETKKGERFIWCPHCGARIILGREYDDGKG